MFHILLALMLSAASITITIGGYAGVPQAIHPGRSGSTVAGTLIVPPNPGNLSAVEYLKQSDDYVVEVKRAGDAQYTSCFVYKSENSFVNTYFGASAGKPGLKRPQTAASFTNFSFAETSVDVRITSKIPISAVKIRPLNFGVTFQQTGNVVTFSLASPKKVSVEINDRNNPLFLFADMPDVPNPKATYYYGPGVHNIGRNKLLQSNESVYIAGGAVVEGSFLLARGSSNISLQGRGILSMGEWPHTSTQVSFLTDNCSIRSKGTANLVVEGFIIAHSTGWTVAIENSANLSHDNQYRNLKLVCWNGNSDGIWFDGDNNVVDDCFIFNNDDIVTTHGSNNCKITNIVAWGGVWGRLFMHTDWASSSNLTFENINLIGKDGGPEVILVEATTGKPNTVQDITFRNLRIEEHPKTGPYNTNKFIRIGVKPEKYSTTVRNWLFDTIALDDKNPDEGDLNGTVSGPINGLIFRNIKMAGAPVKSLEDANMDKNEQVLSVLFN